jgi:hypothetical protein
MGDKNGVTKNCHPKRGDKNGVTKKHEIGFKVSHYLKICRH